MAELGALPIDRSRLALPTVAWSGRRFEERFPTQKARLAPGLSYSMKANSTPPGRLRPCRSEEHTSELQSLMRISYAVFCLKKKNTHTLLCTRRAETITHSTITEPQR